jgi:hypothetical protein
LSRHSFSDGGSFTPSFIQPSQLRIAWTIPLSGMVYENNKLIAVMGEIGWEEMGGLF